MTANKATWILPFLITAGLLFAACGDSSATPVIPADDAELKEGQDVYTKNCSRCHLNDGAGGSGPQLNEGAVLAAYPNEAEQKTLIVDGRGRMPGFGGLTDEEVDAVVRYTREIIAEEKT